jgi:ferric-dicitrate binding protein FerR (iron transport regulator)
VGTEKRERQKANRALRQQQELQQAARRKRLRLVAIGVAAVAGVFLLAWIASTFVGEDDPATPSPVVTEAPEPTEAPTTEPTSTEG